MWMAIWHSHWWGSQWFRTNHHQESRFTWESWQSFDWFSFLPFILYECICFRFKRGSRDEEHTVSFRDKMGQGDVPLSLQLSWLARLRACVGPHVQVHSCITILQQEHYRRRLNMTKFLCRELFFILWLFLPNKMFKIIGWARLDLWLYCNILVERVPETKLLWEQPTFGWMCVRASWNSWPTSLLSSSISVCRLRSHTDTDWLWRWTAPLAMAAAPSASPIDSRIFNCSKEKISKLLEAFDEVERREGSNNSQIVFWIIKQCSREHQRAGRPFMSTCGKKCKNTHPVFIIILM